MPVAKVFIDSSTFLYTLDDTEPHKRGICLDWLDRLAEAGAGVTNLQVLNEMANVLFKKARRFPQVDVASQVDVFAAFGTSHVTLTTVMLARQVRTRTSYSWWDCVLVASALRLGCTHFLSEDLQDGQAVDGLTIVDPFAHSPRDVLPA